VSATRVRIDESDLKDINPDSALYKRVQEQLAEAVRGAPYCDYANARLTGYNGPLEFDEDAVVSLCDDGAYVMAWVFVPAGDLRIEGYLELEDDS
jgi:hypothetical protein